MEEISLNQYRCKKNATGMILASFISLTLLVVYAVMALLRVNAVPDHDTVETNPLYHDEITTNFVVGMLIISVVFYIVIIIMAIAMKMRKRAAVIQSSICLVYFSIIVSYIIECILLTIILQQPPGTQWVYQYYDGAVLVHEISAYRMLVESVILIMGTTPIFVMLMLRVSTETRITDAFADAGVLDGTSADCCASIDGKKVCVDKNPDGMCNVDDVYYP